MGSLLRSLIKGGKRFGGSQLPQDIETLEECLRAYASWNALLSVSFHTP